MESKAKVRNLAQYEVVINLIDFNGRTIPIPKGGVIFLKEDELAYVLNTSKIFEQGVLRIDNKADFEENLYIPYSPNALSEKDIIEIAGLAQNKLSGAIKDITSIDILTRLKELAIEANKSIKFISIIEKRIEEVFS